MDISACEPFPSYCGHLGLYLVKFGGKFYHKNRKEKSYKVHQEAQDRQ